MIDKKLLFILGKGGVGRTTVSTSLGLYHARHGRKTLIVQWTLEDKISPLFDKEKCGHKEKEVSENLYTMNYSAHDTMEEYFVDHLKLKIFYNLIIENSQLQKLIQAGPGVQELFFLGRLFWLIELAEKERGWSFDKIIVDMPAMGHAVSLFNIAPTIAKFGITGPLAVECARVSKMLADEKSTGTVIVTLPEDLPVEETIEFYPKICHELSRSPDAIFINRSLSRHQQLQKSAWQEIEEKKWFLQLKENLSSQNRAQFEIILKELLQRYKYQDIIKEWSENLPDKFQTSLNFIPDFTLSEFNLESAMTVQKMCLYFEKHFLQ